MAKEGSVASGRAKKLGCHVRAAPHQLSFSPQHTCLPTHLLVAYVRGASDHDMASVCVPNLPLALFRSSLGPQSASPSSLLRTEMAWCSCRSPPNSICTQRPPHVASPPFVHVRTSLLSLLDVALPASSGTSLTWARTRVNELSLSRATGRP